ncbi:hypothetical protein PT974_09151 [Cladobotryum mycophilum]|uniref:Uncharacterized protein n=1 Tax=Cladobotryum mycophilum TaxID=491253 RepID=A0ABR0SGR7_9HYPO
MPVRTPASCRRTVPPPPALASQAGIWITDSILGQALENYNRRYFAPCRHLSSYSGPLESRHRLGKRKMTGLMPSTPIYSPLWHFEVASIPGTWQWEPPTTQEERRRKGQGLSVSTMFNHLIGWLEKSDADKPFIQPPPSEDPNVVVQATAAGEAMASDVATGELYQDYPVDFPQEIVKLRDNIGLLEAVDDEALFRLCKTCRRSLTRRIRRGHLSVEGLLLALEPFDQETRDRLPDQKTAGKFAAMIRRSILTVMDDVQSKDPKAHLQHLWLAFAAWVCASGGGHSNNQLFWRLMHVMPEPVQAQIPPEQIFHLTRSFIIAQAARHNIFTHWNARAENFAEILERLSASQREKLEADVESFLAQDDGVSETKKRMRFAWLVVRSFDAKTTNEAFIHSYQAHMSDFGIRLNSLQLWQLMVGRVKMVGVTKEAYSQLIETENTSISRPNMRVLGGIGEMENLAEALLSAPAQLIRADAVHALVVACDDHRLALELYASLEAKSVDKPLLWKHFSWSTWAPYMERMIKDPELDSAHFGKLLNLGRIMRRDDPDEAEKEVQAKVELLDKMSRWYMETTHLNARQLFRRIGECAAIQRSLINIISPETLANLTGVITSDLERGEWGRTTRLEWLIRLVADTQGDKQAEITASTLKGWRSMNDQNGGGRSL